MKSTFVFHLSITIKKRYFLSFTQHTYINTNSSYVSCSIYKLKIISPTTIPQNSLTSYSFKQFLSLSNNLSRNLKQWTSTLSLLAVSTSSSSLSSSSPPSFHHIFPTIRRNPISAFTGDITFFTVLALLSPKSLRLTPKPKPHLLFSAFSIPRNLTWTLRRDHTAAATRLIQDTVLRKD